MQNITPLKLLVLAKFIYPEQKYNTTIYRILQLRNSTPTPLVRTHLEIGQAPRCGPLEPLGSISTGGNAHLRHIR